LNRDSDLCKIDARIGCKRLILKLPEVLIIEEVEEPNTHPNQRLILIQKWYDPRDIQLTLPAFRSEKSSINRSLYERDA
jgi:hypothetical protein